jgi:hypothetical protein
MEGRIMKLARLPACLVLALATSSLHAGAITGTVVNTSTGTPVPCQVEIVLQTLVDGQFVPLREGISDQQGRFAFNRLPVGDNYVYQVGATRHGIFYPGPRIRLNELQPAAQARLSVCDAAASPCPLVLKKMDVTIRAETGILKVTESLVIDNPSHTCYVGTALHEGADPVTLELSIPPDFERTTFDQEFFGRRFMAVNGKLVTGIPWTPGERVLSYTYVLRNTKEILRWQRPMDLPCSNVTIRVEGKAADEVRCELPGLAAAGENASEFASQGQEIPAGQVLSVELGRLPLPWMSYGKWVALAIMIVLIVGATCLHFLRRRVVLNRGASRDPSSGAVAQKKAA